MTLGDRPPARAGGDRARADHGRAHRGRADRDRGAVTAEFAIALPAVVLVLGVVLSTVAVGAAQLRCQDGARAGARLAAMGEEDGRVVAAVHRAAGTDAEVVVVRSGEWVEVTVSRDVPGPLSAGPLTPRSMATAWVEP